MRTKYTKEFLEPIVASSTSMAQVLRKLGLKECGGNYTYIPRIVKEHGIDTSHFLGQGHQKGRSSNNKKSWQQILVLRESRRESAVRLRRALIEYGREYKCEMCGQKPEWNGKELRLQVDHKNGNGLDNQPENIRFVCPNCHTQTCNFGNDKGLTTVTNFKGRYKSKKRKDKRTQAQKRNKKLKNLVYVCLECKEKFTPDRKNQKYCKHSCATKHRRKSRPSKEILAAEMKIMSWCALGRKYKVTDNAVRKWARNYELI